MSGVNDDPGPDLVAETAGLPLVTRVSHKHWKVRENAYRELRDKFAAAPEDSKVYPEFALLLPKAIRDANAAAQIPAMDCLIEFVQMAPMPLVRRVALETAKGIAEKAFTSRPRNKQKGIETFVALVGADVGEAAVEGLITIGFGHKTPKIVVGSLEAVSEAVATYSAATVPVKSISARVPKLLEHSNPQVRAAAKGLVIELQRWMGKAVNPLFKDAKDVTVKELEAAFARNTGKPQPKKKTRKQEARARTNGEGEGTSDQEDSALDDGNAEEELDLREEVNIMERISKFRIMVDEDVEKGWFVAIESKKWKVRKEALELVVDAIGDSRLTAGPHVELITRLRKILAKDTNVNVAGCAARVVGLLASGLRTSFPAQGAKLLTVDLFGRLKEKNRVLVTAVTGALDSLHSNRCITINDLMDEISTAAAHKAPKARTELLHWLDRCFRDGVPASSLKGGPLKNLGSILVKLTDDSVPDTRDAALSCIASLQAIVGERKMKVYLEQLDKIRKEKVASLVSKMPPRKPMPARKHADEGASSSTATKKLKAVSKARQEKAPESVPEAAKPSKTPHDAVSDDEGEIQANPEEVAEQATQKIEGLDVESLSAKSFKARLESVGKIMDFLQNRDGVQSADVDLVLGLLLRPPGLEDSNFRSVKAKLEILGYLAENSVQPLPRKTLKFILEKSVEKLGDIKCAIVAKNIFMTVAESTSGRYFFGILSSVALETKNARAQVGMLKFAISMIEEFGIPSIPADSAIALATPLLGSEAPAIRKAAISLAAHIAARTPEGSVRNGLAKQNTPAELMEEFDNEMMKHKDAPEPPTRKKRVFAELNPDGRKSSTLEQTSIKTVDQVKGDESTSKIEIKPPPSPDAQPDRLNIAEQVTGTQLVRDLGSRNWKVRQDALITLDGILEAASGGIEPYVGPHLMPAIRARLLDSNRNLAAQSYVLLGRLGYAMGPGAVIHVKSVLPTVFGSGCIDIKRVVREAALECLTKWCQVIGLSPLVPYLATPLASINSNFRKDFLDWLLPWLRGDVGSFSSANEDLSVLIEPSLSCLRDKVAEVRQLAEWVIEQVVLSTGFSAVEAKTLNLSKSVRMQLEPVLEKFRDTPGPSRGKPPASGAAKVSGNRPPLSAKSARTPAKGARVETPQHTSSRKARLSPALDPTPRKLVSGKTPIGPALKQGSTREDREKRVLEYKEKHTRGGLKNAKFLPYVTENVSLLGEDLSSCVSQPVLSKMLAPANRFQLHAEAIDALNQVMNKNPDSTVPVADVLLRWAACRMNDVKTPSTILLKAADFVSNLCEILQSNGTKLSNYEASAIMPVLIDKCGTNREIVRTAMRASLQAVEDVLSDEKIMIYLAEGLRLTRNSRSKIFVANELAEMMDQRFVESGALPENVLPIVTSVAAGPDEAAGRAAAKCIDRAHHHFGDEILTMLGPVSKRQTATIQDRLDSISGIDNSTFRSSMSPRSPRSPDSVHHGSGRKELPDFRSVSTQIRTEDFRLSVAPSPPRASRKLGKFGDSNYILETPIRTQRQLAVELLHESTPALNRRHFNLPVPKKLDGKAEVSLAQKAIDLLRNSGRESCIQGLEVLFEETNQSHSVLLNERAAEVLPLLCRGFRDCFERLELQSAPPDEPSLLKKYLNALMSFARIPEVMQSVNQKVIERLLSDILDALVPSDVPDVADWERVRRGINLVVLKILDFCDRNVLFSSLINVLLVDLRMPREYDIIASAKSNLCLKSISKVVKRGFKKVNIDALLRDVHLFITAYPPSSSLDGTSDQQQSLRLLKTILDALIQFKGSDILNHLTLVPSNQNTPLVRYINAILEKHGLANNSAKPTGPDLSTIRNLSSTSPALFSSKRPRTLQKGSSGLQSELTRIFQRIRTREDNDIGLRQLKAFKRAHPEVDVTPHIEKCSDIFQKYIKEGLERIDNEESTVEIRSHAKTDMKNSESENSHEESGRADSPGFKSAGQVYLARLRDIQVKYGLTVKGSTSTSPSKDEDVVEEKRTSASEKENGEVNGKVKSSEIDVANVKDPFSEARDKTASFRERMAKIREASANRSRG